MTAVTDFTVASGRRSAEPTLGVAIGRVLIAAGAIFGLSNLFQYGVVSGVLHLSPAVLSLSWPAAVIGFLFILRRLRAAAGEAGQRAARWSRLAILLQVCVALTLLAVSLIRREFAWMLWMSPIGLGTYAAAWTAAMARGRHAWMFIPALGAACAAGVVITQLGTPQQYLAYALGLFAFVLIPGLWLARAGKI